MNEDELIELLQSHLPEDLTAEQIAELRRAMKDSPRLRDALLEELSLEQSLSVKYAPTVEHVSEIVSRIAHQVAGRRRMRWMTAILCVALAGAVAVGGVLLAVRFSREQPAKSDAMARRAPGAETRPATQPVRARDQDANAVVASAGSATSAPARRPGRLGTTPTPAPAIALATKTPGSAPAPGAEAGAAWTLFDPIVPLDARTLRDQFRRVFDTISGSYTRKGSQTLDVHGRFRLTGTLDEAHMLRLATQSIKKLIVDAWHGDVGARIILREDKPFLACRLVRRAGNASPTVAGSDQRWEHFHKGAVDFRYQDGQFLLACGDVVLLAVPMPEAPTEVRLNAECNLYAAALLPCRRLRLPKDEPARVLLDSTRPNGLKWSTDRLKGAELLRHDDGSLELRGKDLKEEPGTTAEITTAVGKEICLRLADFTHKAAFAVHLRENRHYVRYYVATHRDTKVLVTDRDDHKARERAFDEGLVVGESFWVRLDTGLDRIRLAVSTDANCWRPLREGIRLDDDKPAGESVFFGLVLPRSGTHRAKVTAIRIRQRDAIVRLADPDLLARVPETPEIRKARTLDTVRPLLAAAKPKATPAPAWRLACDAAIVQRSQCVPLRRAAAGDLLETAIAHGPDVDAVRRGLEEFADLTYTGWEQSRAETRRSLYDRLAQRCFATGRRDRLLAVLDSWLRAGLRGLRRRWSNESFLPPSLARLILYDLLDRRQNETLAYQAARVLALHRTAKGDMPHFSKSEGSSLRLAQWMESDARAAAGETADDTVRPWEGTWSHPLRVQTDRDTMNAIAEFAACVQAKAYEHAARALANQTLPDGLVPTDPDGQLYRAIHYHVRRLIQTHPDLARLLREQFAPLADVRLHRALRVGDIDTLQTLAVYFHGTAAARKALTCLADRELSMGNGAAAGVKYRTLLDEASDADEKHTLAAKYRLASALAGQLAGKPVTKDVSLPGKRIAPGEFEAMVASLVRSRRGGQSQAVVASSRLAPAGGTPRLSRLCRLTAAKDDRSRPFTRHVAWARWQRELIVHQRGRLAAIHLDNRQSRWSHSESLRDSSSAAGCPAWPVVTTDRLYARMLSRRGSVLACIDPRRGKTVWLQRLDDGIASDPVLVNSWLYVLTHRMPRGNTAEIYLHRISPETGRSSFSARLLALRRDSRLLDAGQLALAGDSLLIRCSATLVCCDLLGEVRWIHRLTYVPPDVDRALLEDVLPGPLIVTGHHVLLTSPCSPTLNCIDVRTGSHVWSHLQPQLHKLVGLVGQTVVLAAADSLEGLDVRTGKLLWRTATTARPDAITPAEGVSILCVTLNRADKEDRGKRGPCERYLRWLSAADGTEIRRVDVPAEPKTLYDVAAVFATNRELILLTNHDKARHTAEVWRASLR